jgi:hypothetical protein
MGEDTRDIAMTAKTLIDHHMTDCNTFRENLRNDLCEFRDDIKKLYWRVALILGGLMLSAHIVDWVLALAGKK